MTEKLVYFAHGKESGPWGSKINGLAQVARSKGYAVESPDYSHSMDPQVRVAQLLALRPLARQLVLVGSSMGGYVSAMASRELRPAGLFLLAPAVYMPGYEHEPAPQAGLIEIVHGWDDDVIPPAHALRLAQTLKARLHMVPDDHRLLASLDEVCGLFAAHLERLAGAGRASP